MEAIKFTSGEWDFLEDRLVVGDAIADVLWDTFSFSHQKVWDRTEKIRRSGQKEIDWKSRLDIEIIKDAAEGSTLLAKMKDAVGWEECSKGKYMAYCKIANSLEEKLDVHIPRA